MLHVNGIDIDEMNIKSEEHVADTNKEVDSEICRAADMTYTTLREKLRSAYLNASKLAKRNEEVEFLWAE